MIECQKLFSWKSNKYEIVFTWFHYNWLSKNKTLEENIRLHDPRSPRSQKITTDLKLYLKLFSLKQKANQVLPANKKNQILSLQENSIMFLQTITSFL